MKKVLIVLAVFVISLPVFAQAPVNFNCNDCANNNHDLFTELAAGKVIVISWVMPCTSCIGPSLTAQNVVASYASSNPGQVKFYVADDAANTSCTSLNSWMNTNSITADASFSNSAVVESAYGSGGMPKIVVFGGGSTPAVFFNQNGSAAGNSTGLQNAINAALATGVNDPANSLASLSVYPDPSDAVSHISFSSVTNDEGSVELFDAAGRNVKEIYCGAFNAGNNVFEFNTAELSNGIYFITVKNSRTVSTIRVAVSHE